MSLQNVQILIVDDDPHLRVMVRKILSNIGALVFEAENADQALAFGAGDARTPHLIIADLNMPGRDGFYFLEKRKQVPALSSVPVIVASAVRGKEAVYRAIMLGASDYLLKPLNATGLIQKVRKTLKDRDFSSLTFEAGKEPAASFSVGGKIREISDTGFTLELPVKIAGKIPIRIHADILKDAGLDTRIFQNHANLAVRGPAGSHSSKINVVGLDEPITKKIRERILAKRGTGEGQA